MLKLEVVASMVGKQKQSANGGGGGSDSLCDASLLCHLDEYRKTLIRANRDAMEMEDR